MDFTQAELERINLLYGTDFKDITPDDALLIGRWEAQKAVREDEHRARIEAMNEKTKKDIEHSTELFEKSMANLEELHDMALSRLKAVENEQAK